MKQLLILLLVNFLTSSCSEQDRPTENKNLKEKIGIITNSELPSTSNKKIPSKTLLEDNNVFVIFTDGTKKQLTFNRSDTNPILLPNNKEIVYFRNQNISQHQTKIIMIVSIDDLKEILISDQKPYKDGIHGTTDILTIENPTLSSDGNHLLFVTEKYVTGNQLAKVDLKSGVWTELFTADYYEQIVEGPYKGYFLVGQSDVGEFGRAIYYRLVNNNGEIIKRFSSFDQMKEFKKLLKSNSTIKSDY